MQTRNGANERNLDAVRFRTFCGSHVRSFGGFRLRNFRGKQRHGSGGNKWRCVFAMAVVWMLSGTPGVSAHIVHPGNAYADIGLSPYKDEIVYASKLGLIAGEESGDVFRPADPLARVELAAWAAAFGGLAGADEDAAAARQAAQNAGLIGSLEGTATYGDINRAIFAGGLTLDDNMHPAGQEVTREQYAAFVAVNASALVDGKRLEERAGLAAGPAGIVKAQANGQAEFGYELVIGERTWTMSHHPRVVHGAGDPALWNGRTLTASWINAAGELELLDFRPPADAADTDAAGGGAAGTDAADTDAAGEGAADPDAVDPDAAGASATAGAAAGTTAAEEAGQTADADHSSEAHHHHSAVEPSAEVQAVAGSAEPAIASSRSGGFASYWPVLPVAIAVAAATIAIAVSKRRRKSGT